MIITSIRELKSLAKRRSYRPYAVIFLILPLFLSLGNVSAAQWNVGIGQDYNNIQEAIYNVNTADGDIINVFNGTYEEDVVVNKNLIIKANNNDTVTLKPVDVGFNIVNDTTGNGGGTKITGFIINLINGRLGMNISADHCMIENNTINGGEKGIITIGNNTLIKRNKIFGVSNISIQAGYSSIINEAGSTKIIIQTANNTLVDRNQITGGLTGIAIMGNNNIVSKNTISNVSDSGIALVGSYPIISDNKLSNMVGPGSKIGITVAALNLEGTTGLTMNNNILNNIRSADNKTTGIDIYAMSMDAQLDDIIVKGNKISDISGFGENTGISVVTLALKGAMSSFKVSDNIITNIVSQGINSTCKGIYCLPMGFDGNNTTESETLLISKNKITKLKCEDEGGQCQGLSYLQLIQGNSSISENYISEIVGNTMAAGIFALGIDYTTFKSQMTINRNQITDIIANNATSGIMSVNMGDMFILHNNIFHLYSNNSRFITTQPILSNATIMGNNLEGTGKEIGISVNGNSTISYNRMVNFQYYIKNMVFLELVMEMYPFTDEQLRDYIKSQYEDITDEQLDEIIAAFHKLVDYMNSFPSYTTAPYNWYGTNTDPGNSKFSPSNGTINFKPWLILNINANPPTIQVGQTSKITTNVYKDSIGGDHSANAVQFFSGPWVTFTTNLGNIGSKSIIVNWINGLATAILRGDEGPGLARVTATDYQTVQTFVTILGVPVPHGFIDPNVIKMQDTGMPITYILMALTLLLGGLVLSTKK